jgi:flagellar biosynthetic protein FliO
MDPIQDALRVIAVLGVLVLALWWLRKRGLAQIKLPGRATGGGRRLELLERLPLTPQHSLHLVRCEERTLLIAVSPSGCQLLEQKPIAAPHEGGAA